MQSSAAMAATTELQSSEAASAAVRDVLFMSPQKTNKGQTGATGQGRAKARSIVMFPLNWRVAPPTPKPLPQAVLVDF